MKTSIIIRAAAASAALTLIAPSALIRAANPPSYAPYATPTITIEPPDDLGQRIVFCNASPERVQPDLWQRSPRGDGDSIFWGQAIDTVLPASFDGIPYCGAYDVAISGDYTVDFIAIDEPTDSLDIEREITIPDGQGVTATYALQRRG